MLERTSGLPNVRITKPPFFTHPFGPVDEARNAYCTSKVRGSDGKKGGGGPTRIVLGIR